MQILRGKQSAALSDAVSEMADEGVAHLLAARSLARDLSAGTRAVLLPATVAELVLQRLQRCNFCPYAPELRQPLGLRLTLTVGWRGFRGVY